LPPLQQRDHGRKRGGIAGAHFEKQSAEDAREDNCAEQAHADADEGQAEPFANDHTNDGRALSTECDSNGELVRATSDDVGGIVDRRVVWMKGYGYADLRLSALLEDGSGAYPIATTR